LAAASTPAARAAISTGSTTATGTTPKLVANTRHSTLPAAIPVGAPTAIPVTATAVACQQTAAAIWRRTNPSALSNPASTRLLATLTSSRCSSVAAPNTESVTANSSGKFTDSPKLTSSFGSAGRYVSVGYLPVCRASAALPAAPGAARTSTTVPRPFLTERWQADCRRARYGAARVRVPGRGVPAG